MSCNYFYSDSCSVKSIDYLELLCISLCSLLVALDLNERVTTRLASKYVGRGVPLEGVSYNIDLFLILFRLSGWNMMKSILFCSFYTSDTSL